MNKNIAFIVFGLLAAIGIAGTLILQIHRPDATATFTALLVQVLGLVVVAGGLGAGLNSVQQKLETVQKQTNGTLSALREDNARLHEENAKLSRQLPPEDPSTEGHGR